MRQNFQDALYANKGRLGPWDVQYADLRERYARGRITLGAFEAEVEILLRSAA